MNTFIAELDDLNWVEVLDGKSAIHLDIVAASQSILVHLSESSEPPELDAVAFPVRPWTNGFDWQSSGFGPNQRIWARMQNGQGAVIVAR
jgi:hypothetical protein